MPTERLHVFRSSEVDSPKKILGISCKAVFTLLASLPLCDAAMKDGTRRTEEQQAFWHTALDCAFERASCRRGAGERELRSTGGDVLSPGRSSTRESRQRVTSFDRVPNEICRGEEGKNFQSLVSILET